MDKQQTIDKWNQFSDDYCQYMEPINLYNFNMALEITFNIQKNENDLKLLEIACGSGQLIQHILKFYQQKIKECTINDISNIMIEKTKKRVADIKNVKIDIQNKDCHDLDYQKKQNIIIGSLVVHFIPNPDQILNKVYNALEDNGLFLVSILGQEDQCSYFTRVYELAKEYETVDDKTRENFMSILNFSKTFRERVLKNKFDIYLNYQTTVNLNKNLGLQKMINFIGKFDKKRETLDENKQKELDQKIEEIMKDGEEGKIQFTIHYYILKKQQQFNL